jgi:hypothetical protein
MVNSSGLKDHLRSGVWLPCAMTTAFLSDIRSSKNAEICSSQLDTGQDYQQA